MYSYIDAMVDDIKDVATDYDWDYSDPNIADIMNDDLWVDDSVTGNGSGEYVNSATAKEYVVDNMALCTQALDEFCVDKKTVAEKFMADDWSYFDVTIRCYLLYDAIYKFLKEKES